MLSTERVHLLRTNAKLQKQQPLPFMTLSEELSATFQLSKCLSADLDLIYFLSNYNDSAFSIIIIIYTAAI